MTPLWTKKRLPLIYIFFQHRTFFKEQIVFHKKRTINDKLIHLCFFFSNSISHTVIFIFILFYFTFINLPYLKFYTVDILMNVLHIIKIFFPQLKEYIILY